LALQNFNRLERDYSKEGKKEFKQIEQKLSDRRLNIQEEENNQELAYFLNTTPDQIKKVSDEKNEKREGNESKESFKIRDERFKVMPFCQDGTPQSFELI
jgi:hypothetical protein